MGKTLSEEDDDRVRNDSLHKMCSSVFTAKNINHTAWYGNTRTNQEASYALSAAGWLRSTATLAELIECAYALLSRYRRCQYLFKNTLIAKTVFGKYSPGTTAWLPEFRVAESRADAVLVNGCATVFEIKTAFDDFSRLHSQLESYYLCFPRVVLLVDPKHAAAAQRQAPPHAGVSTLTPRLTIRVVREPAYFSESLSSAAMFRLLRKREYQSLAQSVGLDVSSLPARERFSIISANVSKIPPTEMHGLLVEYLRSRHIASSRSALAERLPRPLTAALYEYRVRKLDWEALIDRLEERCAA